MVGGRSRLGVLLGCRLIESACARGGHRAARRPSRAGATMSPTEGGPSSKGEHSPETERLLVAHAGAEVERQARGQGVRPATPYLSAYLITGLMVRPPPDPSSRHRTRASLPSTTRVGRAPRVIVRALAALDRATGDRLPRARPHRSKHPEPRRPPRRRRAPDETERSPRDTVPSPRTFPSAQLVFIFALTKHVDFDPAESATPAAESIPGYVPGLDAVTAADARERQEVLRLLRRGRCDATVGCDYWEGRCGIDCGRLATSDACAVSDGCG